MFTAVFWCEDAVLCIFYIYFSTWKNFKNLTIAFMFIQTRLQHRVILIYGPFSLRKWPATHVQLPTCERRSHDLIWSVFAEDAVFVCCGFTVKTNRPWSEHNEVWSSVVVALLHYLYCGSERLFVFLRDEVGIIRGRLLDM